MLPNPHWNPELRPLSGRDEGVRKFLEADPEAGEYVAQVAQFLDTWLPRLRSGTRSYATVSFGCTGGRHRSVYLNSITTNCPRSPPLVLATASSSTRSERT
jgi:UPF0042 nucleotide-binding protein